MTGQTDFDELGSSNMMWSFQESESCPSKPQNDRCPEATVVDELPYEVEGNNQLASSLGPSAADVCYYASQSQLTTWWEISPNSTASCLSAEVEFASNSYGVLAVYSGLSCRNLFCVGQWSSERPRVSWKAEPDAPYYLMVAVDEYSSWSDYSLKILVRCLGSSSAFLD